MVAVERRSLDRAVGEYALAFDDQVGAAGLRGAAGAIGVAADGRAGRVRRAPRVAVRR